MVIVNVSVSDAQIADFCRRWKIKEIALFGSALRGDGRPDSDIDFLVTFAPDANWGILDHFQMEEELEKLLGRKVDVVSRLAIERSHNWIRKQEILSTARTLYAA
jgi:hypothetical protein